MSFPTIYSPKYPLGAYYVPDAVQGVGVTEVKKTWSFNIQET